MAITIVYPPQGTAAKPTRLTRRFIAVGVKAANDIPLGVMISVDGGGVPDNKYRIGGSTFYQNDNAAGTKWAMHFQLPPKVRRNQRFKLVVFNTQNLPASIDQQNLAAPAQIRDYLFVKGTRKQASVGNGGGNSLLRRLEQIEIVESPTTGGEAQQTQVVAYGYLPDGDVDIHPTDTVLVKFNDASVTRPPDWSWTDGGGFWAAFFPDLTNVMNKANLTVVYTPSASEEEVTGIDLV